MTEAQVHGAAVWAVIGLAIITFVYLLRVTAPLGRHYTGRGWGPHISNRIGWVVMELPTTAIFLLVYFTGDSARQFVPLVFLAMWQGHYLHRTFVYPFRTRGSREEYPGSRLMVLRLSTEPPGLPRQPDWGTAGGEGC